MELKPPSENATIMQNALYFVHLANAAYENDPESTFKKFPEFQFEKYELFRSPNGVDFGIAARIDGALIVALRGTDDPQDWWSNFQFGQLADYDGKVHAGFYVATNRLWKDISRILWKTWKKGDKVWLAGHSLGGAMATLVARWLAYEDYELAGVYTFGQPRVGDNAFVEKYPANDVHYRFVNNKDFVPQVPYRWMGPGIRYEHVGKIYQFDKDGTLNRSQSNWNKLVDAFTDNMTGKKPDFGFADHAIKKYIGRIETALS